MKPLLFYAILWVVGFLPMLPKDTSVQPPDLKPDRVEGIFEPLLVGRADLVHPIKVSLLYMDYKPDMEYLYLECRLFGDDMVRAIEKEMGKRINITNWTESEREIVNEFINQHIEIGFGSQDLQLEFFEYEYDPDRFKMIILRYEMSSLVLKTGEEVTLANNLFFKQFPMDQINCYELKIPSVVNASLQCRNPRGCEKTYTVK